MNKFRKWMIVILAAELLVLVAGGLLLWKYSIRGGDRPHLVEAGRVAKQLETADCASLSLDSCRTIREVRVFDSGQNCGHDYVVADVNGVLYRICYEEEADNSALWLFTVLAAVIWLTTAGILWYVEQKILKPFDDMTEMTAELAKGNLSVPVKEERSRYFGKFLWGLDMLREKLESGRKQNLEYQKEKKTLILSMSHDIKTPLSAISLYVRALQRGLYDSGEKRAEIYAGIERNTREIENYVSQITKTSREDFLELEVNNREFYLKDVMEKITAYYSEKLGLLQTVFETEAYENLLLKGDADRIIEVLQNILENAVKYGDGKRVQISFGREEDCCLIRIENTGSGVKEDELNSLFDSFYRGSNAKGIPGAGLGLYICRNLLRKMDGDIFAGQKENLFTVTAVIRMA